MYSLFLTEVLTAVAGPGTQPFKVGFANSAADVFMAAVGSGFRHIVPDGLDHIAFLLGLFFLSREIKPLLWQVTWFTLAHSLTLGLVLLGAVSIPLRAVEVAVALSIAVVAAENIFRDSISRWRPWMILGFGLVHGLAFAHTFEERPASEDFLPALFGFNVGIELGQIAVIGLAILVCRSTWSQPWYRRRIAIPASFVIAICGFAWAVERWFTGSL